MRKKNKINKSAQNLLALEKSANSNNFSQTGTKINDPLPKFLVIIFGVVTVAIVVLISIIILNFIQDVFKNFPEGQAF
jgi:hypothetical protein